MKKFNDITIQCCDALSSIECNYWNNEHMVLQLNTGDRIFWSFGEHGNADYAYIEVFTTQIRAEIISYNEYKGPELDVGRFEAWHTVKGNPQRCTLEHLLLEHLDLCLEF